MTNKTIAIITACGRGTRLMQDSGIPKQYLPLLGVSILRHSVLAFLHHPKIDGVVCIIHPDDISLYENATSGLDLLNPIFGGETRQSSIRNGLIALKEYNPNKVLIHDAVRPFVSKSIIDGIVDNLEMHPAVIPAVAVEDTLKKIGDGKIEWTLERENLWRAQTPQGFIYQDILNSHTAFKDMHFTDDSALNEYAGIPVAIIPGSQNNFKITTQQDYERAQYLASSVFAITSKIKVGSGFDIHSFDYTGNNNFIRLGGIDIPFAGKIIAHSDGDVVIHALIDALLGAVGLGDIGEHFPPSDDKWLNCDSQILLNKVISMLASYNTVINNVDITIIAEQPKILDYKAKMRVNLANLLGINSLDLNIKATTTEKLGFLGRKEGIACQASVCLTVNYANSGQLYHFPF
jgi:2-C-methyl-D-erythritol 4-phosphate cytidylyltransferase/2-C-methyl-D-erythritol 2,4-cyclodiphosphate synthase